MELAAYHLAPDGTLQTGLSRDEAVRLFKASEGLLWMDILNPHPEDAAFFESDLGFHPLRAEICISPETHVPIAEELDDYLFINAHGVDYTTESEIVQTTELSLFLGHGYVVSSHRVPLYAVEAIKQLVDQDVRLMRSGADFLVHALLDSLVGNVEPTIDKMLEYADLVEEEALRLPQRGTVESILKLRRSSLSLYRVMVSQQNMLNRMARGDFDLISQKALPYFRDVYEQVWRIVDLTQTLRERADSALTTYLSSVANRQNESMRLLSMIAAIFLPLTLLTGIWGMNFVNMPELKWPWAYFAVLGLFGTVIGGMVWVFWARRWIRWGHHEIVREARRVRPFAVEVEKVAEHMTARIYRAGDRLYLFNSNAKK